MTGVPARAEVVVVGGGVMGTSIAYHLAAAGVRDVVVVEAASLGSGSSGKPLGGVRAQFSGAANIALGARSLRAYASFGTDFGVDIGLERVGYLFLLRSEEVLEGFRAGVELQNAMGVRSRVLDAAGAAELCPYLDLTCAPDAPAVLGAAYSPGDGYARPGAVVQAYARAASRLGVSFVTDCAVTGIGRSGGRVAEVATAGGDIACTAVVCAAGAWSRAVGAMAGVDLPVDPLRRQVAFTAPFAPRPRLPFTIDYDSTCYFHASDDGLLVGMAEPDVPVGFGRDYDDGWLPGLRAALRRCAPTIAAMPLERGWAGLYEMTPDRDALIGTASPGFFYATGFSGHGFLQAPAVGEVVRDLYLGVEPMCDVSAFSAARFAGRAERTELAIV